MFGLICQRPQDAPLEKLRLLARLDTAPQATLSVKENGTWQVTSGSPCLPQGKSREVTFQDAEHLASIRKAFDDVLSGAGDAERSRDLACEAASNALRGLSYHFHIRFRDREPSNPRLRTTSGTDLLVWFKGIEDKLRKYYVEIVLKEEITENFTQHPFIIRSPFASQGACFGIATYWCLRFINGRRKSYTETKKHGKVPVVEGDRISQKTPLIHRLQIRKDEITESDGHTKTVADILGEQPMNPLHNYHTQSVQGVSAENPRDAVQRAASRNFDKYHPLIISNKKTHSLTRKKVFYSMGPNSGDLMDLVHRLFVQMSGTGRRAYVLAAYFSSRLPVNGDVVAIDYFAEDKPIGHAFGILALESDRWSLLDPNYGEVQVVPKGGAEKALRRILAAYLVTCRLYRVTLLEVGPA